MGLVQAAFSFGRDRELASLMREALEGQHLHDLRSDIDANRTWLCFSGDRVGDALLQCCRLAFDRIDLSRHVSEFPRTGALDNCRFVDCDSEVVSRFAEEVASQYEVPIFRSDLSPEWTALRELGFGGLTDRELVPDYGPARAHPNLGVAAIERGPIAITVSAELDEEFAHFCQSRSRDIRQRRDEGDPEFARVSAVAYATPTFASSRLVMEFSDPDLAPPDPILDWLERRAKVAGVTLKSLEIIGAIKRSDLIVTRHAQVRPEQIYEPE